VFSGGFSLAAATTVCGNDPDGDLDEFQMLDVVDSLVRKSLAYVERDATEPRFNMLETIRQFAEERLAESADSENVRDLHASYFADRAEASFELFRGPQEAQAYQFVDDEIANVRAAFRWAVDHGRGDAAIRIAACVHQAARQRLRTETFGWAAEVADLARRIEHPKLPLLLTMAADSAWGLGLLDDAKRFGHEAIALADDSRFEPIVWAYSDLAQIAIFEGDVATSLDLLRTGAAHPVDRRDRINLAILIYVGGAVGQQLPDDELATAMTQINEAGFPMAIAIALNGRAASVARDDPATAIELQQQVIDVLESCGNRLLEQSSRAQLVNLLANADDPDLALAGFMDTVNAWRINGDTILAVWIGHLVVLLVRLGHYHGAAQLYGAATRSIMLDALVPELEAAMSTAREALGDEVFRRARAEGAALSYQAAGELASDLITHARAELTSGL
jgi:hypothetical protein